MRFGNQLLLLWLEVIAAQPLDVFERIEELELLICVCKNRWICTKNVVKRLQRASVAPAIDQRVECFEEVEFHRT